jgi:ABC-type phosphate transport system substrate-binding protein
MVPVRLLALLILAALAAPPADAQVELAVVVHADVHDALDVATVRRVFLARQHFWRDGTLTQPVNQGARTPLRLRFSQRVLGGRVQDFTAYWNDLWFHGTAPPPVLGSDQAVLLFVARTPGAIGYVDAAAARASPDGIRIALVLRLP